MLSAAGIEQNRLRIEKRVAAAAAKCGRTAESVRIMAVTKTQPDQMIQNAIDAGITLFGENRVKEAQQKYTKCLDQVELHLIGHLQRNKAKEAAGTFSWVDSIDKWETAAELDKRGRAENVKLNVLVEVNTSGESSKYGVTTDEDLWELLERIAETKSLTPRGVMTVGPLTGDQNRVRSSFRHLKDLFDLSVTKYPSLPLDTLSMGMSGDFEIAVEEGSNLIRIGTALLGSRNPV